ncbi:hypothetical protein VNO77_21130 [Canavalia gladiata]|uniref:Uncharacterized protein n=1 Tax=Canavalia gladiata TaxID=3824 RepID=A0AAN9QR86_CANGL
MEPLRHRRLAPELQLTPQSLNGTEAESDPESLQEAPHSSVANVRPLQLAQSQSPVRTFVRQLNNTNRGNSLSTSDEAAALTFGAFLHCLILSVTRLSPRYRWSLLTMSCTLLNYEAKFLTAEFDSKLGMASGSLVLSFGEAIAKLLPGMGHSTLFIVCYPLILLLACPLPLILQIVFMMVLIFVPLFYFPELMDKVATTGVEVACGSFKLPLLSFTIAGTLALSFICILLILIGMYLIWRYILKGKPSLQEPGGSVNDLSQILVQP